MYYEVNFHHLPNADAKYVTANVEYLLMVITVHMRMTKTCSNDVLLLWKVDLAPAHGLPLYPKNSNLYFRNNPFVVLQLLTAM